MELFKDISPLPIIKGRQGNIVAMEIRTRSGAETLLFQELTSKERLGRKLIGTPVGKNLEHCVYLGLKYHPGFPEQAAAFYIDQTPDPLLEQLRQFQPGSVKIEFYARVASKYE